jgi:hypothetical protein
MDQPDIALDAHVARSQVSAHRVDHRCVSPQSLIPASAWAAQGRLLKGYGQFFFLSSSTISNSASTTSESFFSPSAPAVGPSEGPRWGPACAEAFF